ncbi:MAG TPA: helix-turn-helix domain-containing protein [Polyangiales bacterium]
MVIRKSQERNTGAALVEAATAEFAAHGFAGTDSNKIARAAGFAPQTFYRWFRDKTEIFIAVYRAWEEAERRQLSELLARGVSARRLAEAIVAHHREHLVFRRSLRLLAVQDDTVRRARAESRLRQIEWIRASRAQPAPKASEVAVVLLQIERLADAIAEGELSDMELSETAAHKELARLIDGLGGTR